MVAMSIGGCEESIPEPIDAGQIQKTFDAGVDGGPDAAEQGSNGAGTDAAVLGPDAAVPPPPDAYVPPPPPDAPDGPDH